MRIQLLTATVLFWAITAAAAPPPLADKLCNNGKDFLTESPAKAASAAAAAGKISLKVYEELWWATCDHKSSLEYAALEKKGEFDLSAFQKVLGKSCLGDTRLARPGAAEVAKAAAANTIDVKTFTGFWDDTCEFNSSFEGAKAAKAGKLDAKAFHDYYSVVYGRCLGATPGRGHQAQKMATGVKDGSINRDSFLRMWNNTCKFEPALAAGQRKLTRSPAFVAPTYEEEREASEADAK